MPHVSTRLAATVLGLGSLLAAASWAPEVDACSPQPAGWAATLQNDPVPSNGFVIVSYYCYEGCDPPVPDFTVRDSAGTVVDGQFGIRAELGEGVSERLWRATTPLAPGVYQVDLPSYSSVTTQSFNVVAPAAVVPPTPSIVPGTELRQYQAGEQVCCPGGPIDTCGGRYCYATQEQRSLWIMLDWSLTAAPEHWSQYMHRVRWEGAPEPNAWSIGLSDGSSFETAQTEYCYTMELKSLIDDSIVTLERSCVAHPEGYELGSFDIDPAIIESALGVCEQPPAGHEQAWCEARTERCDTYPSELCNDLEDLCSSPPLGRTDDGDGGCSVAAAGVHRPLVLTWLLGLLALRFRVRFRRAA